MADDRPLTQQQIDLYLEALELSEQDPSLPALQDLVRAHLERVPFENISKLYYMQRFGLKEMPPLERFLEGIRRYHFGGTCYSNNYYLNRLLLSLRYDVRLCGADMSSPDVHIVNIV
ncbi:MAG TPA: arylamine N-acetyltransferase, partial [Bacteroidota bacterium]|nr:arylamine N-acetyltransferase [Bacteroidota bacterium]